MRWPHAVLVLSAAILTLGLVAVQMWVGEQQLALQKAEVARQQAAAERHKADWDAWQALAKTQPGQLPPPPPALPPPVVLYQPPLFVPWFPLFLPLLMGPLAYVAAAEQQRLQKLRQHEEEQQTPYSAEELMDDWEFKIIRCPIPLFEQPAFLESILREEALAGWRLVEKFDGTRVRLKRRAGQPSAGDLPPGYDPYRTAVGPRAKLHVLLWTACVACVCLVPALVLMQVFDPIRPPVFWTLLGIPVVLAFVLGFSAARQTVKYRKLANPGAAGAAGAARDRRG